MKIKSVSKLMLLLSMIVFISYISFNEKNKNNTTTYYLKSSNNSVVLIENEKIIKKYKDIVLENLPMIDQNELKKGIKMSGVDEADFFIENYDG